MDQEQDSDQRKQHDLVLKTVLHHFFGDLVEIVEPDFAARVDLTNIEFLEQETFSDFPGGTRQHADLVARLTSRDGEGRIVLVQTEVEGQFRSKMDERGFYYYLYLRGKYRVPVLLVAVFLQGGKTALTLRQFVDRAEGVEVCRFRYVAFFLGQNRAEDFVNRPQPLAAALAALMKSDWDPVEKKLHCLQAISRAAIDDARRFLLAKIVDIYVELDEAEAERYAAEVNSEDNEEVREMVITWEETIAASKAEGEATLLLRQFRRKFGPPDPSVEERLKSADAEQLLEWGDRFVTANTPDEVFDGNGR